MESPALSAPTVSQLVMLAAWTCLNDTPPTQKNPLFARFFKNQEELEAIAEQVSLAFTPGLLEVLNSAAPPPPSTSSVVCPLAPISAGVSTPSFLRNQGAVLVYTLVLHQPVGLQRHVV